MDRRELPCWHCPQPQGADVRHFLSSATQEDLERQSSPSGFPIICCHVRMAGVVPAGETVKAPMPGMARRRW
jgi:hypothetical protein